MAGTALTLQPDPTRATRAARRPDWSAALTAGVVVGATVMVPSYGDDLGERAGSLNDRYDAAVRTVGASSQEGSPAGVDAHLLEHLDPMWERAVGVSNDACRDPRALKPASAIRDLPKGASAAKVLRTAGQPHSRLDDTLGYCARTASGKVTKVEVDFDGTGHVARVH